MRTTNFQLFNDKINFSILEEEYEVYRYRVPSAYHFIKDHSKYAKLTIECQEKLNSPFYFFTKDQGGATVYFLKNKNIAVGEFIFESVKGFAASPEKIAYSYFNKANIHILVKLMTALFFYKEGTEQQRICQAKFFVLSEEIKDYKYIAIELSLKTDFHKDGVTEFNIIPTAHQFIRKPTGDVKSGYEKFIPYYEHLVKGDTVYLRQLKRAEVKNHEKDIWTMAKKYSSSPVQSNWYTYPETHTSKSHIVFNFQKKLVSHLNKYLGEGGAKMKAPRVKKFKPKGTNYKNVDGVGETGLPIKFLKKVYVYDNRLRKEDGELFSISPVEDYLEILNEKYGAKTGVELKFEIIEKCDLNANTPILVLQDFSGKEFKPEEKNKSGQVVSEEGFLYSNGYLDDPKKVFYNDFPDVPKQSINVNSNKLFHKGKARFNVDNFEDYFQYECWDINKPKAYKHKLDVCLNDLFLKNFIMNDGEIFNVQAPFFNLPCFIERPHLQDYAFMHGQVFLYFENEKLNFVDISMRKGKALRTEVLKKMGINWIELDFAFRQRCGDAEAEDFEAKYRMKLRSAHFVFTKDVAFEILDTEERVLFDYEYGEKRNKKTKHGLEGIFYLPDDYGYSVGEKLGLNMTLAKAVKVKRLHFYQGSEGFKEDNVFETLSIEFVRNKQYTVYPYLFDLIRLYLENKNVSEEMKV